ncbi:hypothetical protein V8E36_004589 [Tilletia maclaganii]
MPKTKKKRRHRSGDRAQTGEINVALADRAMFKVPQRRGKSATEAAIESSNALINKAQDMHQVEKHELRAELQRERLKREAAEAKLQQERRLRVRAKCRSAMERRVNDADQLIKAADQRVADADAATAAAAEQLEVERLATARLRTELARMHEFGRAVAEAVDEVQPFLPDGHERLRSSTSLLTRSFIPRGRVLLASQSPKSTDCQIALHIPSQPRTHSHPARVTTPTSFLPRHCRWPLEVLDSELLLQLAPARCSRQTFAS